MAPVRAQRRRPGGARTDSGLAHDDLVAYREAHPLAGVMPVVRELVVDAAADDGLVVAVSDDAGRLLWVEGDRALRDAVDRVGFVEGSVWREERVGTNAPGTALATRSPVQVLGAEHFSRPVQAFSCTAVPSTTPRPGASSGSSTSPGASPPRRASCSRSCARPC